MLSKLISIGEVLVDFIPIQKDTKLKDVLSYERMAGGAPANVAACVSKLGGESIVLSKLGTDAFGDFLIQELKDCKIDTTEILRTNEAKTGLAFVSLDNNGNRDFSFYRNPSADMLLNELDINENLFSNSDILHFCSISLIDAPIKKAHKIALQYAIKHNCIISFDPNIRLPLWNNPNDLKSTILEFMPYAHILKISDDELEFITGTKNIEDALTKLFIGNVQLVLLTKGKNGCELHSPKGLVTHPGFKVQAKDTTGAGDGFIGAFLFQLLQNKRDIVNLLDTDFYPLLEFANAVGAIVASKKGAMKSMPQINEVYNVIIKSC